MGKHRPAKTKAKVLEAPLPQPLSSPDSCREFAGMKGGHCGPVPVAQPLPQLLTIPDFCREFRVSRAYTYVLLRKKMLKGVKIGRMTRVHRSDAEAWAAALPPVGHAKRKPAPKLVVAKKPGKKPPPRKKHSQRQSSSVPSVAE